MRAGAFLAAAAALPRAELDTAFAGGCLVVAPHPDDESLGCAVLIAEALRRGRAVHLVVVSDGAGSHPNSATFPPARLSALRETETLAAAATLGLAAEQVTFLRLPDRHVPSEGPIAERAAAAIARAAVEIGAGALFTTWRHDPHCDHRATFAITRAAASRLPDCRLFSFTVWGWRLDAATEIDAAPPRGFRLDGARHRPRKRAAIAAHRSQTGDLVTDDPDGFRLPAEMIERLVSGDEVFVAEPVGAPAGDTPVRLDGRHLEDVT